MFNTVENTSSAPYDAHRQARSRRIAEMSRIVSHTAASVDHAYERASMPAQVILGSIAKRIAAQTETVRLQNWRPSTATPAAAPPIARQLDRRDQNSVAGNTVNQPCMPR